MLYALLCYGPEDEVAGWSPSRDTLVAQRCRLAVDRVAGRRLLARRLMPTSTAVTVRDKGGLVVDGPFDQTREQLLGFWLIDCASTSQAVDAALALSRARGLKHGALEIRPVDAFDASQQDIARRN